MCIGRDSDMLIRLHLFREDITGLWGHSNGMLCLVFGRQTALLISCIFRLNECHYIFISRIAICASSCSFLGK